MPSTEVLKIHDDLCDKSIQCSCASTITRVASIKYLGIYLDQYLKWNTHTDYINNKIRKLIYKFRQLKNILTVKLIRTVYTALVESILNYGIIFWGAAYKEHITNLEVTQKWIIKIILGKQKLYPSELVFSESNIYRIRELYSLAAIKFTYKWVGTNNVAECNKPTRAASLCLSAVPFKRITLCQQHVSYLGPKLYNRLSVEVRALTPKYFNKGLKAWLKDNKYVLRCEFPE